MKNPKDVANNIVSLEGFLISCERRDSRNVALRQQFSMGLPILKKELPAAHYHECGPLP